MNIRTTVVATTAIFAAVLGAQAPATAAQQSNDFQILLTCDVYSTNQTVTRSQVIARAQSWIDERVSYNQGGCYQNQYGRYRMDCSGLTSMAWGLSFSHTTYTLDQVSHVIPRSELKPGDALNKSDEHVAIFAGWADAARTQPIMLNHGGDPTNAHRTVWSADWAARFTPIRYNNIVDDVAAANEAPAVVVEGNGAMQAFGRDTNTGKLVTSWQSAAGSNWSGWTTLNIDAVGTPSALLDDKNQMNTFTRRADGHLIQMVQDGPDGEIKSWWDLGGTFAGDPVAVKQPDGKKVVFARGTDGQLWHKWQNTPDGEFQTSALVHPNLGAVTGKPAAFADENNLLTVFTVRADGHLIMAAQPSKTEAWKQWDLGGDFAGDPAAVRTADGKFVVFVRGTDGKLWVKWQNTKGGAFPDSALVNTGFGQIVGAPAAVINPDGLVQVFARRTDGHLATAWQGTNGVYTGFDDLGGNLSSDPSIGITANGAKAVFARFADGSIMTTWQPKPGDPFNRTWSYLSR